MNTKKRTNILLGILLIIIMAVSPIFLIKYVAHFSDSDVSNSEFSEYNSHNNLVNINYSERKFINSDKPSEWTLTLYDKQKTVTETSKNSFYLKKFSEQVNIFQFTPIAILVVLLKQVLLVFIVALIFKKKWVVISLSSIYIITHLFSIFQFLDTIKLAESYFSAIT